MPIASFAEGDAWRELAAGATVIVDELIPEIAALLTGGHAGSVFYVARGGSRLEPTWRQLPLTERVGSTEPFVKLSIPLNPLAQKHRHNGFGFVGYHLVLSGRHGPHAAPPAAASWLTAAFHDQYVVVVEDGMASAWRGRALRGRVHVDSRMDLWRLIAHAAVCIDLDPGNLIARECIEALRFGTPIMVPVRSGPATVHAAAGRGFVFEDPEELVHAVAALDDEPVRRATSTRGRDYATENYSNPGDFADSLKKVLGHC